MPSRYKSDRQFEAEVRRIAEVVFDLAPGGCQNEILKQGNRSVEVDGVARTRHVSHLLMATTSPRLDKVKEDVEKLVAAAGAETADGRLAKKWLIVEQAPEGPHVAHAKRHGVELITIEQFRGRFFDGRAYLSKRKNSPFGSARDLTSGLFLVGDDEYIEPPLVSEETGENVTLDEVIRVVEQGRTVVLLGPFGCGKSLTLREAWRKLRDRHLLGSGLAALALNLREHWGARFADELLTRHARSIGFEPANDLTVAWRAGLLHVLVDGFDEMASQGVLNFQNLQLLRAMRQDALVGVRDLLQKTPAGVGVLTSGRDHYFDDESEMRHALGLQSRELMRVRIGEFDDARATSYLRRIGFDRELPTWLPRRALLLGYLAKRKLLESVLSIDSSKGHATAWVELMRLICEREAEHDRAAMDPDTLERVLENLAVQVRALSAGTGPISASMLAQAYTDVTGESPNEAVLMQLQRLPGLTERDAQPGSRSFVDADLLETLQGAAIARAILEGDAAKGRRNRSLSVGENWLSAIGSLAAGVAAVHFRRAGWKVDGLVELARTHQASQFGADLFQVALEWGLEDGIDIDARGLTFDGVHLALIDLDEHVVTNLVLKNSIIDQFVIGGHAAQSQIDVQSCWVRKIVGAVSLAGIPSQVAIAADSTVDVFDSRRTTNTILDLDLSNGEKALVSVLKKLFVQKGAAREHLALRRGLPESVRQHVDAVVHMLTGEKLAWTMRETVHPNRTSTARILRILDNPRASTDELMVRARAF